MENIDSALRLGDLVNEVPGSARVFERHQLDYCCGGGRSLDEACSDRGLDASAIVAELVAMEPTDEPDWASMSPVQLVDHIEATHHRYLADEFGRLGALAEKVAGVHGGRHPELLEVRSTHDELRADLEPHLAREERVLFPMIRELSDATVAVNFRGGVLRHPVLQMLRDHDRAGELLGRLRGLTADYRTPDDGCASFRSFYEGLAELESDTHLHIHKENNLLFPAVLEMEHRLALD
jgi:regulator of cell morphogenesis and NO signaling